TSRKTRKEMTAEAATVAMPKTAPPFVHQLPSFLSRPAAATRRKPMAGRSTATHDQGSTQANGPATCSTPGCRVRSAFQVRELGRVDRLEILEHDDRDGKAHGKF